MSEKVDLSSLLPQRLASQLARFPRLVLGYSGGLDSTVLLAALVRAGLGERLLAVHVHHGLQPQADDWLAHCREQARAFGVAFAAAHLNLASGANLEERARDERRRALLGHLPEEGALLLAQHADDQAETLLLRLLRGAGPRGLAAMSADRDWHGRRLLRPLLDYPRAALEQLAALWQLQWIDDPSNAQTHHDRNYLRQRVMPLLHERWPAASDTLGRDAALQSEAAMLLDEMTDEDLQRLQRADGSLDLEGLRRLSPARRANLVYGWLRRRGIRPPARKVLARLDSELLGAGEDRQPEIVWPGAALLRFRDGLYLLNEAQRVPLTGEHALALEPGVSRAGPVAIEIQPAEAGLGSGSGIILPGSLSGVRLAAARGGERLLYRGLHRQVSELWRQAGLPPWCRRQLPLFWQGEQLLAVAGIGAADDCRVVPGEAAWKVSIRLPGADFTL